jgi:hypothetical protein
MQVSQVCWRPRGRFPHSLRTSRLKQEYRLGMAGFLVETDSTRCTRDARGVEIRIEGFNLPGRSCGAGQDFPGYDNIHVGVQRRSPRDQPSAVWTLECEVTPSADFKGPYIQGRPHERFIYLSWGAVDGDGTFNMFRRAKLWLDAIDAAVLDAARGRGRLVARLGLTDAKGHPLCASVRPPVVQWSAV